MKISQEVEYLLIQKSKKAEKICVRLFPIGREIFEIFWFSGSGGEDLWVT